MTIRYTYNRPPAANPGFALSPSSGTLTVGASGVAGAAVAASATAGATGPNPRSARVDLSASAAGRPETRAGSADLQVLWYPGAHARLASTFNNKGITDDANPTAGSFDGGEATFSAQGLAAAGLSPRATFVHDGMTFTWPDTVPGEPDNTATDGQVIALSGSGTKLGIVGSACCSPIGGQSGTVYVSYEDGTIAGAQLAFADWYFNNPAPGTDVRATVPWECRARERRPGPSGQCVLRRPAHRRGQDGAVCDATVEPGPARLRPGVRVIPARMTGTGRSGLDTAP